MPHWQRFNDMPTLSLVPWPIELQVTSQSKVLIIKWYLVLMAYSNIQLLNLYRLQDQEGHSTHWCPWQCPLRWKVLGWAQEIPAREVHHSRGDFQEVWTTGPIWHWWVKICNLCFYIRVTNIAFRKEILSRWPTCQSWTPAHVLKTAAKVHNPAFAEPSEACTGPPWRGSG